MRKIERLDFFALATFGPHVQLFQLIFSCHQRMQLDVEAKGDELA